MQQATFHSVEDLDALEEAFRASSDRTVVIFLDDPYCPISYRAHQEVAAVPAAFEHVDVSSERTLSREIERRTGIRHESPQIIVVRDGRPLWSASHGAITAEAVKRALEEP